jgi:hypothetical protein
VTASTIGLLAVIAVLVLAGGGRPVPTTAWGLAALLPLGLVTLLVLVVAEARRSR